MQKVSFRIWQSLLWRWCRSKPLCSTSHPCLWIEQQPLRRECRSKTGPGASRWNSSRARGRCAQRIDLLSLSLGPRFDHGGFLVREEGWARRHAQCHGEPPMRIHGQSLLEIETLIQGSGWLRPWLLLRWNDLDWEVDGRRWTCRCRSSYFFAFGVIVVIGGRIKLVSGFLWKSRIEWFLRMKSKTKDSGRITTLYYLDKWIMCDRGERWVLQCK